MTEHTPIQQAPVPQPPNPQAPIHQVPLRPVPSDIDNRTMRPAAFKPPRRRWPGVLIAAILGAGIAAALVSSYYDDRTLGARLDETVSAAEGRVDRGVSDLRGAADGAAAGTAVAADRVASALSDTGITAAVKTALAADPSLSALKVQVNTSGGVVRLDGPAPDAKARERAGVLAAAPDGVRQVDNRLVIPPVN